MWMDLLDVIVYHECKKYKEACDNLPNSSRGILGGQSWAQQAQGGQVWTNAGLVQQGHNSRVDKFGNTNTGGLTSENTLGLVGISGLGGYAGY